MGDVAEAVGGGTPKSTDPSNFAEVGHPWITPADLSNFENIYIGRGRRDLSDKGFRTCSATVMPPGAVLMSSRAPIGYLAIASSPISTNQGFKSFVCREGIVPEFVFFWLKSIQQTLEEMGSGSTFSEISGRRAKEIPLLLAPTSEQKRIADKLQQLLLHVSHVTKRLARVPAILKRFRQSVLAAACSGRLTEDLRETTDAWSRVPFGALLATDPQNGLYKPQESYGSGVRILRIDDYHDGRLNSWESLKRVRLTPAETEKYALRPADILINRVNSPKFLGKGLCLDQLPEPAVFESNMMRCTVNPSKVEPGFADLFLRSPQGVAQLRKNAKHAVNQASINQQDVVAIEFPLPPIDEQREIARRAQDLLCLADRIGESVASATTRVGGLTQAVLARAFRGELVPTEAELARRDGRAYEPAGELLSRVRAKTSQKGLEARSRRGHSAGSAARRS